jgi:thiamine-phosphate pyrophosphorylase
VIATRAWPLLLITDPAYPDERILEVVRVVGLALSRETFAVQLRDKGRDRPGLARFARVLRDQTRASGVALVVNGDAHLAREVGADGVHLGGDAGTVAEARAVAGREAWISIAAHDDADVQRARDEGADAVLVSPIFQTPGKGAARGVAALRSARSIVGAAGTVIYALGGIRPESAEPCRQAGADGVAVIRALLEAPDPAAMARALVAPDVRD